MNENHKPGKDGLLEDGVSYYPADANGMQTFEDAKRDLAKFSAPVLVHASDPHERLYFAAFDGTETMPSQATASGAIGYTSLKRRRHEYFL